MIAINTIQNRFKAHKTHRHKDCVPVLLEVITETQTSGIELLLQF